MQSNPRSSKTSPFALGVLALLQRALNSNRTGFIGVATRTYLLKRQVGLNPEVKEIAWKAQNPLHLRHRKFLARGKNKPQIVTAVGRELLGFVWAIGVKVEAEQQRIAA